MVSRYRFAWLPTGTALENETVPEYCFACYSEGELISEYYFACQSRRCTPHSESNHTIWHRVPKLLKANSRGFQHRENSKSVVAVQRNRRTQPPSHPTKDFHFSLDFEVTYCNFWLSCHCYVPFNRQSNRYRGHMLKCRVRNFLNTVWLQEIRNTVR